MKISSLFIVAALSLMPMVLHAQGEALPLAEEGSPEAENLRQAHEADLQGAMESPEEAAQHQKALEREEGGTPSAAPSAPSAPPPASAAPSTPPPAAQPTSSMGAPDSDLAVHSEPEWLQRGGNPNNPPAHRTGGGGMRAAPAAPAMQVQVVTANTIFTPPLRFGPWSTTLGTHDQAILNQVAKVMKEQPDATPKVVVAAYSDNSGDPAVNEALTIARANVVKAYLISQGVGVHRLEAKGMGDANPIASNDTAEGRAQNRRVEFHIEK